MPYPETNGYNHIRDWRVRRNFGASLAVRMVTYAGSWSLPNWSAAGHNWGSFPWGRCPDLGGRKKKKHSIAVVLRKYTTGR